MRDDERPGERALSGLIGFGRALRGSGVPVGEGQVLTYCRAAAQLDPTDLDDLYWAGRACLVSRRADLDAYDRTFREYFLGRGAREPTPSMGPLPGGRASAASPVTRIAGRVRSEERSGGAVASGVEILRRKSFAECTPEELAALRRLGASLRVTVPKRRTRRTEPARRGRRPDVRRTVRRALRTHGEVVRHSWRRRRERPRKLVLILDVSGSMAEYSRVLLQFAHSAATGARHVEAFCFGTRLTRVTEALRRRDPDRALADAAVAVVDWEGGTRIGESLREFMRAWGRHGKARGAVVIICSDGLERGDPEVLREEMARLSRLAHRVVWVNPLKADPGYRPLARGMRAALPHIDVFVSGHDLASLKDLAALLPAMG